MVEEIGGYAVHPAAKLFPLIEGNDYEDFKRDLQANGQQEPIMLIRTNGGSGEVLDGRNRLRALTELGAKPEFDWYGGNDPIGYVLSRNLHRRHMNESQRANVGARLKPMYEEEAQARMLAGKAAEQLTVPATDDPGTDPSEAPVAPPSSASEKGRAREKAAQAVNVGTTIISKAEKVLKTGIPELVEMVDQGRIRIELAEKLAKRPPDEQREVLAKIKEALEKKPQRNPKAIVRRHDKDIVIESIRREPKPLPDGPFRVIVADWPWLYEKRQDDGTQRGQTPYPTTELSIQDGIRMGDRVQEIAHLDCILWFWTTNAHMPVAHEIVSAWGFTHKTILTWKKTHMGTGDWLRGITEHCIMATRGNPVVNLTNETTFFEAPTTENHSEKPDEFYEIVEKLCPGSKLEMFSRKGRDGWQVWGAEAGKLDAA